VATTYQTYCERCESRLVPGAAYCERCGERTRKAKGMVRLAIRVELVALAAMALLTIGFVLAFYVQH